MRVFKYMAVFAFLILELLDTKLKRRIIKLLVEAICFHSYETVLINFFSLLKGFEVSDLLFEFKRLIMALQWLLFQEFTDELMLGEIVSLLKNVAHPADGVKRQFMCDRGLISDILKIVHIRLQCDSLLDKPQYDDLMNRMWKTMLLLTGIPRRKSSSFKYVTTPWQCG
ncbi:unnamed protein product [Larinioides sclopetarius]|uniref:Protein zer-1 homolog-like C-terminal domain-containing protein n=1 Tax=Larinioides sclopetarius TaxID=280406 RepID=A0AAV2B7S0_9ARAC